MNFGAYKYFFDHTRAGGSPWMSDQLNAGATYETTRTLRTIHAIHSLMRYNKADIISIIMMAKLYSGKHMGLKLPDMSYR